MKERAENQLGDNFNNGVFIPIDVEEPVDDSAIEEPIPSNIIEEEQPIPPITEEVAKEEVVEESSIPSDFANNESPELIVAPETEEAPTEQSTEETTPEVEETKEETEPTKEEIVTVESKDANYVDSLIKEKMSNIKHKKNVFGVGKVTKVKDFIIEVVGLESASFYEKINIANKAIGYVTKLESNHAIIAVLTQTEKISIGDEVYQTNEEFMGDYSSDSLGRIVDLFGNDKLTNQKFSNTTKIPIEEIPAPIMDRTDVVRPLQTGIAGIDLIYPIGNPIYTQ